MGKTGKATLDRRQFMAAAGGVLAAAALAGHADATPAEADEFTRKLIGNARPKEGRIELRIKDVAESGANEPVTVAVESPMTAADHVKAIHVIADGNPAPGVSSWFLTPKSGKAEISFRMRLAKTQTVRAYAVMSDGQVFGTRQEVKVTIGGCGG